MKTPEIIKLINDKKICSPHFVEDEIPIKLIKVADINPDEHRWYIISTLVFKHENSFIGVAGPTSLKSESMGFDDVGWDCEAFEMEAIPSITYVKKK